MNMGFLPLFIAAGILYQFSVCRNSTSSNPKFSPVILIASLMLLAFSSKIIPGNELLPLLSSAILLFESGKLFAFLFYRAKS